MVRSLRYRFFLLALVGGLTLFPGLVFAQALPVPVNISPVSASPAGLQSVVTFDARGVGGAANAGYYSRPVLVSNNTLSGLGKGLARRALPVAAFTAAVAAAGWAIDELTKQVQIPASGDPEIPPGGSYWVNNLSGHYFSTPSGAAQSLCTHGSGLFIAYYCPVALGSLVTDANGNQHYWVMARDGMNTEHQVSLHVAGATPLPNSEYSPAQPVADAAIADLVKDNPQLWNDALRNPDGSVNRNPDVQGEAQRLADELLDPEASPQPDPTAEWDTGLQGGDPQHSPTALEFPVFCTWASKVCELADWLMADDDEEPPANEIDWIDPEAAVTWSSGLGGGSCPADVSASLPFGGEVTFPMGQFCEAADMIRPLVLVSAALIAAMIIGGYRRAS